MGYKLAYSIQDIETKIRSIYNECNNPRNDGYIAWGSKQDLYQIKWLVDDLLQKTSKFSGEDDWLKQQEQNKIINILKDK
jgi:hypothetical protein